LEKWLKLALVLGAGCLVGGLWLVRLQIAAMRRP